MAKRKIVSIIQNVVLFWAVIIGGLLSGHHTWKTLTCVTVEHNLMIIWCCQQARKVEFCWSKGVFVLTPSQGLGGGLENLASWIGALNTCTLLLFFAMNEDALVLIQLLFYGSCISRVTVNSFTGGFLLCRTCFPRNVERTAGAACFWNKWFILLCVEFEHLWCVGKKIKWGGGMGVEERLDLPLLHKTNASVISTKGWRLCPAIDIF